MILFRRNIARFIIGNPASRKTSMIEKYGQELRINKNTHIHDVNKYKAKFASEITADSATIHKLASEEATKATAKAIEDNKDIVVEMTYNKLDELILEIIPKLSELKYAVELYLVLPDKEDKIRNAQRKFPYKAPEEIFIDNFTEIKCHKYSTKEQISKDEILYDLLHTLGIDYVQLVTYDNWWGFNTFYKVLSPSYLIKDFGIFAKFFKLDKLERQFLMLSNPFLSRFSQEYIYIIDILNLACMLEYNKSVHGKRVCDMHTLPSFCKLFCNRQEGYIFRSIYVRENPTMADFRW